MTQLSDQPGKPGTMRGGGRKGGCGAALRSVGSASPRLWTPSSSSLASVADAWTWGPGEPHG